MTDNAEMVEHDASPEDLELIKEEPHHWKTQEGGDPVQSNEREPSSEADTETELNFGAVSGFFSGFAAAVQTTVIVLLMAISIVIIGLLIGQRLSEWWAGCTGESGKKDYGSNI